MWRRLKINFAAGLLLLLPLYLTFFILVKLFLLIDGILNRLATRALVSALSLPFREDRIIYGLGLITLVALILLAGYVARHYLGKRFIRWLNEQLDQIPIVKGIYKTLRQIFEALFAPHREAFQRPVLIEYPRSGLYSLAFQTLSSGGPIQDHIPEESITVFLPTTPNPTTGFVMVVPKSQVQEVNLSVEEALKFIISAGVISTPQKKQIEDSSADATIAHTDPSPTPEKG